MRIALTILTLAAQESAMGIYNAVRDYASGKTKVLEVDFTRVTWTRDRRCRMREANEHHVVSHSAVHGHTARCQGFLSMDILRGELAAGTNNERP